MAHYCVNCCYHRELPDGAHCRWCLDFFYDNSRLPRRGDRLPSTVERLWAELDRRD
jgi:hypothetical protein